MESADMKREFSLMSHTIKSIYKDILKHGHTYRVVDKIDDHVILELDTDKRYSIGGLKNDVLHLAITRIILDPMGR